MAVIGGLLPLTLGKDEREERDLAVFGLLNVHHQGGIEDAVRGIGRFVRKVELRDQGWLIRRLRDDVDVPSAAGVEPGTMVSSSKRPSSSAN